MTVAMMVAIMLVFGCAPDESSSKDQNTVHQYDKEKKIEQETVLKFAFAQSLVLKELGNRARQQGMPADIDAFAAELTGAQDDIIAKLRKEINNNQVDISDSMAIVKRWKKRIDFKFNSGEDFLQTVIKLIDKQQDKYETTEVSFDDDRLEQFFEQIMAINKGQKEKATAILNTGNNPSTGPREVPVNEGTED